MMKTFGFLLAVFCLISGTHAHSTVISGTYFEERVVVSPCGNNVSFCQINITTPADRFLTVRRVSCEAKRDQLIKTAYMGMTAQQRFTNFVIPAPVAAENSYIYSFNQEFFFKVGKAKLLSVTVVSVAIMSGGYFSCTITGELSDL